MSLFFGEVLALLEDLNAIRRHFCPAPFASLDYPLRAKLCLPLHCPIYFQGSHPCGYLPPPATSTHHEPVSLSLLHFLATYEDPTLVPDAPSPLLPDIPVCSYARRLRLPRPASGVWSTCVREWWEQHYYIILSSLYAKGYQYHPLDIELWLGVNSSAHYFDANDDYLKRCYKRVSAILQHLLAYTGDTVDDPWLLGTLHNHLTTFFGEIRDLLGDITAIRRHFWPQGFALLDYPLRGECCLPFYHPFHSYLSGSTETPYYLRTFRYMPGWYHGINTYTDADDDYGEDLEYEIAMDTGVLSNGSDSSAHSYCSDDDWEECSWGADSFADHSSTDAPENESGTYRFPGAPDTCTTSNIHAPVTTHANVSTGAPDLCKTSNIHALVSDIANVSTGPRPATCNTTNIHALVTAPATVDIHTDKHAPVTVFPRSQKPPCKYLIKAFQYLTLKKTFSLNVTLPLRPPLSLYHHRVLLPHTTTVELTNYSCLLA